MKWLYAHLYGDKTIWALVILLACFSIMPVYSASTNLVYTVGTGQKTIYYLIKHFVHISVGLFFMWLVHRVDYRYFKLVGFVGIPAVVLLLIYTLTKGTTIGGANASRWISVMGVQFQPSSIAAIVLTVYVAQYLVKIKDKAVDFVSSLWELWLPVGIVVLLILPANFSTAAIISCVVFTVALIGKYPLKYLGIICGAGLLFISMFMITAKAFPGIFPNRVDTWMSRIDRYANSDDSTKDLYQVQNAKIAIASGGLFGVGPGKSVQKNFLPQSSSDFIYAIIVEEYGVVFGVFLLFVYMSLFFRFLIAIHRAPTAFGRLLVVGLGFFLIYQTLINIGVAVSLLPTTGQPLPLISSGGTSIWMTCVALGIILSVTKSEREIQEREIEKSVAEEREAEELKRIQLEREQILKQETIEN